MANPYLSHLISRLHADFEFLSAEKLLDPSDVQFIQAKLNSIPRDRGAASSGGALEQGMSTLQLDQGRQASANGGFPSKGQCKAVWSYQKSQPDDLGFQQGDIIDIVSEENHDWWRGSLRGQTGLFPSNHVERIQGNSNGAPPPPPPPHSQNSAPYNPSYSQSQYAYQQPQYYAQSTEKQQGWQPPPPPQQHYAPPPPPPQNVVVSQTAPVSEEDKKKKFPGGKFGKQIGTAFAGGAGFGAGSAITSNAINAIF
ncbi:hypothetical protein JCM16303_002785 [Sporobolomyces ruberrimus]